jgi:hypothetical protein
MPDFATDMRNKNLAYLFLFTTVKDKTNERKRRIEQELDPYKKANPVPQQLNVNLNIWVYSFQLREIDMPSA